MRSPLPLAGPQARAGEPRLLDLDLGVAGDLLPGFDVARVDVALLISGDEIRRDAERQQLLVMSGSASDAFSAPEIFCVTEAGRRSELGSSAARPVSSAMRRWPSPMRYRVISRPPPRWSARTEGTPGTSRSIATQGRSRFASAPVKPVWALSPANSSNPSIRRLRTADTNAVSRSCSCRVAASISTYPARWNSSSAPLIISL